MKQEARYVVHTLTKQKVSAETIDQEKKVKHSKLADALESVIIEPAKIDVKLKVRIATSLSSY